MPERLPLTCKEPFRTGYFTFRVVKVIVKLPFWALFYLIPRNRPRSSWSWKKAIMLELLKSTNELSTRTGWFRGSDLTKEIPPNECKGARFMWIEPVPANLIAGELKRFAQTTQTVGVRIPAYGYGDWAVDGSTQLAGDGEKIIIHFHGGSYIHGSAHPKDPTSNIVRDLLGRGASDLSRAISVDYRLCTASPYTSTPISFAAPFLDALSSYVQVTQRLRFKPQNIIVSGDSAGAHLALTLVRYLRDNPHLGLGMPGGLLLFSPWTDPMGTYYEFASGRGPPNAGTCDYLNGWIKSQYSGGAYAKGALFDPLSLLPEEALQNPYLTPASLHTTPTLLNSLFSEFPPTYIVSGDAEALIDDIRILARRISDNVPEGAIVYDEVPDAIHDFVAFTVWEPERSHTLQKVVAWIQQL